MTTLCLSYKIHSRIADEDGVMMVNEGAPRPPAAVPGICRCEPGLTPDMVVADLPTGGGAAVVQLLLTWCCCCCRQWFSFLQLGGCGLAFFSGCLHEVAFSNFLICAPISIVAIYRLGAVESVVQRLTTVCQGMGHLRAELKKCMSSFAAQFAGLKGKFGGRELQWRE